MSTNSSRLTQRKSTAAVKSKSMFAGIAMLLFAPGVTLAASAEIDMTNLQNQQALFEDMVDDLGSALSYKSLIPAEPLGILGFDIGLEVGATKLSGNGFDAAVGGDAPGTLLVPKVHLHKGLPFAIDVGAFLSSVPSSNIRLTGAELRYAFIEGNTILPAIAVRGTYSALSGVNHLDLKSTGLELTISKGFVMLTPYAGLGKVKVKGSSDVGGLSSVDSTLSKSYIGLNVNLGLMNLAAETDKTGDNTTTSVKFGFRF